MAIRCRALRVAARDEASAKNRCNCGHPVSFHRELPPTREIVDGAIVERPNPDHRPLHFHCTGDDCACVRISEW